MLSIFISSSLWESLLPKPQKSSEGLMHPAAFVHYIGTDGNLGYANNTLVQEDSKPRICRMYDIRISLASWGSHYVYPPFDLWTYDILVLRFFVQGSLRYFIFELVCPTHCLCWNTRNTNAYWKIEDRTVKQFHRVSFGWKMYKYLTSSFSKIDSQYSCRDIHVPQGRLRNGAL